MRLASRCDATLQVIRPDHLDSDPKTSMTDAELAGLADLIDREAHEDDEATKRPDRGIGALQVQR